jgi:hypothetical protein
VPSTQFKHWKVDSEEMGGQMALSTNEAPLFDGTNYSSWREGMKWYLKSRGSGVWDSVVSKPWYSTTSKNKTKSAKEAKKNNSIALKAIQNGLSDQVKEKMGHCTSAKVLWLQLENSYQNKEQNKEMENSNQFIEQNKETKINQIKEQNSEMEKSNQIEEQNTDKENSDQNKEQNTEEDNSIKELMQTPVINREDYYIKELMNTSVFTKEKLLDFKNDVITTFEVISMEPTNGLYIEVTKDVLDHLEYTVMCTFEELEKLQKKDMLLLQQLDQSNHEEHEQNIQLENKEEEIKRLKTEVANLTEEMEELKTHDNKRK